MQHRIGFIGQGWIGKHYADDFEKRGYTVVRYALEAPYRANQPHLQNCDIVFIAVPTPSTVDGFSFAAVRDALKHVPAGATAVIKSTMVPGTTETLQAAFPDVYVVHSPEFLREESAAHDAAHPERNIIGIPKDTPAYQDRARAVLAILPLAKYSKIMSAHEAELVKYAGNCFLYTKVVFMNMLYDLVVAMGADWELVREAMVQDPRIGASHTQPIHVSGHAQADQTKPVRGAGGHCFIKDFEAFRVFYEEHVTDATGQTLLQQLIRYNNQLLARSGKDLDILAGVYGEEEVREAQTRG
jgi:UDPglucose 6-dehydrogenase